MRYFKNMIDMIGRTPLLKLERLFPGLQVFAKCEFMNPLSLKDRPVKNIIEDAEEAKQIKPGDTIIECTSGNTGMALAFIGALKGYRVVLVMSEIQSVERRKIMKAFAKTDLLIFDDWGLTKLTDENRHDLLEILEGRNACASTLITSQFPVKEWHELIGDPTLADAILDRLIHSAYKIDLKGESMRKKRSKLTKITNKG